jgi:hypothetical protein
MTVGFDLVNESVAASRGQSAACPRGINVMNYPISTASFGSREQRPIESVGTAFRPFSILPAAAILQHNV